MTLAAARLLGLLWLLCVCCAGASLAASTGQGFSIDDLPGGPPAVKPVEPVVVPAGDPCQAGVSQADGIVTLSVKDPARADKPVTFTLDDRDYAARFDAQGQLQARAPMFHPIADVTWPGSDGRRCDYRGIAFTNFQSAVLTALIWTGPYDLALHVVEPPGGRIGGAVNYIYPGRPNADHSTGLGDLQSFGTPGSGTAQVQLYTLPTARNPRHGDVYYFVEFVSRGNPARPPFCGSDNQSTASFKIIHLDSGQIEQRGGSFGTVPCGTSWNDSQKEAGYFQRWKWKL